MCPSFDIQTAADIINGSTECRLLLEQIKTASKNRGDDPKDTFLLLRLLDEAEEKALEIVRAVYPCFTYGDIIRAMLRLGYFAEYGDPNRKTFMD